MASNYTKRARAKLWILRLLDWALLFAPLLVYICIALGNGGVTTPAKVGVVGTVAVAAIITIFNILAKKSLRSPIWIILIGLFVAMKEWLMPLIVITAIATVLDEFVFEPLITKTQTELISNKAIDKRSEE